MFINKTDFDIIASYTHINRQRQMYMHTHTCTQTHTQTHTHKHTHTHTHTEAHIHACTHPVLSLHCLIVVTWPSKEDGTKNDNNRLALVIAHLYGSRRIYCNSSSNIFWHSGKVHWSLYHIGNI